MVFLTQHHGKQILDRCLILDDEKMRHSELCHPASPLGPNCGFMAWSSAFSSNESCTMASAPNSFDVMSASSSPAWACNELQGIAIREVNVGNYQVHRPFMKAAECLQTLRGLMHEIPGSLKRFTVLRADHVLALNNHKTRHVR